MLKDLLDIENGILAYIREERLRINQLPITRGEKIANHLILTSMGVLSELAATVVQRIPRQVVDGCRAIDQSFRPRRR